MHVRPSSMGDQLARVMARWLLHRAKNINCQMASVRWMVLGLLSLHVVCWGDLA